MKKPDLAAPTREQLLEENAVLRADNARLLQENAGLAVIISHAQRRVLRRRDQAVELQNRLLVVRSGRPT